MTLAKPINGNFLIPGFTSTFNVADGIADIKYFTWSEATHGGRRIPQTRQHGENIVALAKRLLPYREKAGVPFIFTSWYRPDPWNAQTPGAAPNSVHKEGGAVDLYVGNMSAWEMGKFFADWQGGMGIYPYSFGHCHLDIGQYARWTS